MQIKNLKIALQNVKSNTIGHITSMTSQKSKVSVKAAKLLGIDPNDVMKFSEIQVQFGSSYKTRVNNKLAKEGKDADFVPYEAWYKMVKGALAVHAQRAEAFYAVVTPQSNSKGDSYYLVNGKKVDFTFIQKLFKPSALKDYGSRQGTDKKIDHLVIGLESITRCAINGKVVL